MSSGNQAFRFRILDTKSEFIQCLEDAPDREVSSMLHGFAVFGSNQYRDVVCIENYLATVWEFDFRYGVY